MPGATKRTLQILVSAKDAASKEIQGIGSRFGGMKSAGAAAFSGIAAVGVAAFVGIGVAIGAATAGLYAFKRLAEHLAKDLDKLAQIENLGFGENSDAINYRLNTLALQTGASLDGLRDSYIAIGRSVKDAGDAIEITDQANRLSTATFNDQTKAAETLLQVLEAYGHTSLDAAKDASVLNDLLQDTSFGIDELQSGLGKIGPLSSEVGLSLGDTAAILETLSEEGVRGTEAIGSLQTLMEALTSPTASANRELQALGIHLDRGSTTGTELVDALVKIQSAAEEDDELLRKLSITGQGLTAALVLARGEGARFKQNLEELSGSAGRFDENFSNANSTLGSTLGQLKNAAEIVLQDLLLPLFREINNSVQELITRTPDLRKQLVSTGLDIAEGFVEAQKFMEKFFKKYQVVMRNLTEVVQNAQIGEYFHDLFLIDIPRFVARGVIKISGELNKLIVGQEAGERIAKAALEQFEKTKPTFSPEFDGEKFKTDMDRILKEEFDKIDASLDERFQSRLDLIAKRRKKLDEELEASGNGVGNSKPGLPDKDAIPETIKLKGIWESIASTISGGVVGAIEAAAQGTKSLGDSLKEVLASLTRVVANEVILQSIRRGLGQFDFFNTQAGADGTIFSGHFQPIRAFASGGIVNRPTLGLIGEGAGPEAVIPLKDGNVPVQLTGGGGAGDTFVLNVSAIDGASVRSFFARPDSKRLIAKAMRDARATMVDF